MTERKASRDLTQETRISDSEATACESGSHLPHNKVHRVQVEVKDGFGDGVCNLRISRSNDSRSCNPVPPDVYPERASSTPNLEDAPESAKRMRPLSGPAMTGQDADVDLDTADSLQDTYLKPLRIFDDVIGKLADVHPYAKMALGVLSCAAKIILAQADRDKAVLELLKKICEVYSFISQDDMLDKVSSMRTVLAKISQQTRECANFINNYSETKKFWSRFGKNVISETTDTIKNYNDVFDRLMQNFRDQVTSDVVIRVHDMEETSDLSGMTYADGAGLDTRKECLEGTRTEILSQITDWVSSAGDNTSRVLWLSGPAGKGKSAIAHTIAKWFEDVGGLGSCYCFDRQREADRRHEKIFSTVAQDLADRNPEMSSGRNF
ncbi:hypothetical protein BDR07DRAFT_1074184 [Suillus spraguei]|nr:hypothetical protein BDR07DRAFT_1074184 [Suillus spraguei]